MSWQTFLCILCVRAMCTAAWESYVVIVTLLERFIIRWTAFCVVGVSSHLICYNDLTRESRCAYKSMCTCETHIWFAGEIGMICTGGVSAAANFFPLKTFRCQSPRLISPLINGASASQRHIVCIFCHSFCLSPSTRCCTPGSVSVDQVNDANGFFSSSFPLFAVRAYYGVNT